MSILPEGYVKAAKPPPPDWVLDILHELVLAYPEIDAERARYIRDKLLEFSERAARAGVNEYVAHGGDELFKIGKCLSYVEQWEQDERNRVADLARQRQREEERQQFGALANKILSAEEFIGNMADDEVMAMWEPIRDGLYTGWTLDAAKRWSVKTIRGNMHLKHHVAGLLVSR